MQRQKLKNVVAKHKTCSKAARKGEHLNTTLFIKYFSNPLYELDTELGPHWRHTATERAFLTPGA